jgi:hypothetical protein
MKSKELFTLGDMKAMGKSFLSAREVRSLDLAAALGGWLRESGTTVERAIQMVTLFRSSFLSHVTSPA